MKSIDIRDIRQQFREDKAPEERKHVWAKPANLVVNNAEDPTTMFNTAGMQQFVPYLMGKEHPAGKRLYNIQGCVRTGDIDEVGDTSHLTFFEMMGNWSLGDYFKKDSIAWSREFLTGGLWLGLDPRNIAVSVFEGDNDAPRDEESADLWKQQGVAPERIAYLPKSENRWGPAGKSGPCGADTEIFYWVGEGGAPDMFDPEKDDENRLEIRNNVFMSYYKDDNDDFSELAQKNVDTGMGFERICLVKQAIEEGKSLKSMSVYDIDIFADIMKVLSNYLVEGYSPCAETDLEKKVARSYRIVADHLRTGIFLVDEGLTPSNEGRGYVLRRILRRGYYHILKMHIEGENWIDNGTVQHILTKVVDVLLPYYPHLEQNKGATINIIFDEMKQFQTTIEKGEKRLQEMFAKQQGDIFSGTDAFILYDTYGVPVELVQELVVDNGLTLDMKGFDQAMQTAQEKSRAGGKKMFAKDIDWAIYIEGLPPTQFVGYDHLEEESMTLLKELEVQGTKIMVFDRTPFYAEGGGQKGDSGFVELDSGAVLQVVDVQKYGGVYLHFIG